jgi:peptidoglycan/LPS O-acetylase OafA/YrhL
LALSKLSPLGWCTEKVKRALGYFFRMPPATKHTSVTKPFFVTLLILWGFPASCFAATFVFLLRSEGAFYLLIAALLVLAFILSAKRVGVTPSSVLWYLAALVFAVCAGAVLNVLYALTGSLIEALTSPRPPPPTQLLRRLPQLFPTAFCGIASIPYYSFLTFAVAIFMIRLPSAEVASAVRTLAKIVLALLLAVLAAAAALLAVIETKYRVETLAPSDGDTLYCERNTAQTRDRTVQALRRFEQFAKQRRAGSSFTTPHNANKRLIA